MKRGISLCALALALTTALTACGRTSSTYPDTTVTPEVTENVVTRGVTGVARGTGDVARGVVNGTGEVIEGVGNGIQNMGNGMQNAAR